MQGSGEGRRRAGGEHEGSRRSSWLKDREEEQGKRHLERGSQCGIIEKPGTKKIPRNHEDDPS